MRRNSWPRQAAALVCLALLAGPVLAGERFEPPVADAVKYLLEHNRDYQKALADRRKAHLNVIETGSSTLPSVTFNATGTRLGKVQSFLWETSDSTTMNLKVAAADNYSFGVNATQLLFSGSAFQAIGVARSYERVSEAALATQRAALIKGFLSGYAGMALLEELASLNQEIVTQTKARFDDARLLQEMGALSRFDLLRSEVEYMNSVPALREAENLLGQAEAGLVLQLGLAPGTRLGTHDFDIRCAPLEADFPGLLGGPREAGDLPESDRQRLLDFALAHRPETDLSANAVEGYRRAVRVYQSGHLPTVAAFANWEHANQWDMFSQNESWRSSWNVGLQASVPLFTGFRTSAQVAKGRQDLRKAREDDSQLMDAIRLELRTALDELQRRSLDMEAWSRNAEAAAEGLRIAETRRESGAGSELELRDARTAMKAARVNQSQARHDLLTARIGLLHALGLLDQTSYTDLSTPSEE
jgi:outer membrane protein TolC